MTFDPIKKHGDALRFILDVINKHLLDRDYSVILFGSCASGKERPTSDIDIAIKLAAPLPPLEWQLIEDELMESDLPRKVDIVDYHRVTETFQKIINETGIKLK